MIRRLFITALLLTAAASLRAQSLAAFRQQLAAPRAVPLQDEPARVVVTEHDDAARAVAAASHANTRLRLRGHRVCIFFDNSQDARAGAAAARTLFEEKYPGIRAYMVYENPYFKVSVGNCLTTEEAIILRGRIAGDFPRAFIKSEELSVADLLE